ncbi:Hypothetical Protein FCC1311_087192 [Hondaea fermentalgiana]|uniref:Uncharacterized protein n=1 Tax=Hondaea fermentalgiana TaxID=2315210 RepID=A0A2R5GX24_9STRA|nr:Hypothetical Protein FCC1311_087192 [Hondaea fermentalgiana]|eukprot:GBG32494.1 Hypothetical Protein FCC1311_087192 [Hondaea fermentalgiana]
MDLFVQLSCGWPSASIAFGPVTLPASHPLAKLAADSNEDASSRSCIGTLSIKSSGDTLPPSELTSAILRLRQEAARFVAAPNQPNPMHVLRFVSSVSSALNDIERVLVGDGGTPKRPTEFQMQFMQRLNLAALQALSAFTEALAALTL